MAFRGRGVRPAAHLLSFASPKESKQRKGDPAVCVPARLRRTGQPAVLGRGAAPWNSLRAGALRSDSHGESDHEAGVSCGTPARPAPCAPRRIQKGVGTTRVFASLDPAFAALRACASTPAPPEKGRAQRWPVWGRWGSLLPVPRSGAQAGRMRVGARMPRELTRRGCPNGAALQRSEFHGGPACASIAGCPVAQAQGTRAAGSPFLCLLSFGEAKESECAAGRTPRPREAAAQSPPKRKRPPKPPEAP